MSTSEITPETILSTRTIAGFAVRCYIPASDDPEDRAVRMVEATGSSCELLRSSADDDEWVLTVDDEYLLVTRPALDELRRLLRPRLLDQLEALRQAA